MEQLTVSHKFKQEADEATSAGTAVTGTGVDTDDGRNVVFMARMNTANAGNYLTAFHSDASDFTGEAEIAGARVVAGADDELCVLEITRPTKRYIRPKIIRAGANTATGSIYSIQGPCRLQPVDNIVSGAVKAVSLISPDSV